MTMAITASVASRARWRYRRGAGLVAAVAARGAGRAAWLQVECRHLIWPRLRLLWSEC